MLLRLFVTVSLRKINEDNLNERDNCGVIFSKRQRTHGPFISLCLNTYVLISLIPPNCLKFWHLLSCDTIESYSFCHSKAEKRHCSNTNHSFYNSICQGKMLSPSFAIIRCLTEFLSWKQNSHLDLALPPGSYCAEIKIFWFGETRPIADVEYLTSNWLLWWVNLGNVL